MHECRLRDPSPRWCPLVADLAGTYLPDKVDGNALQHPHRDTGQCHVHLNGTDGLQHFPAGPSPSTCYMGVGSPFFW